MSGALPYVVKLYDGPAKFAFHIIGDSLSLPLVCPYDWPSTSRFGVRCALSAADRMFMYWLKPSSIQPYHVSLLLTTMGHH